jgi:hypothetical protein
MRSLPLLVATMLALSSVFAVHVAADAAAPNCQSFRYHVSIAQSALVEADVYMREGNDDLTKTNYDISTHELDMADEYGDAQTCLPGKLYNSFWATTFHHDVLDLVYLRPTKARALDIIKETGGIANTLQPSDGADAYRDAMQQYKTMKSLVASMPTDPVSKKVDVCQSDAKVINAVQGEEPKQAIDAGITGDVSLLISLDAASKITAVVVQRSPSVLLSQAAVDAVKASTFQTKVVNCKPVSGDFVYAVGFESQ